ncbi:MAG TPA: ornithine cyclodeaminase family protein [Thermoanaerobaculia bacterium]|jgi:ornithine cyclodeaminase/alanine dehydrogenase-like protein (mu-crystallin family)|nr:ornithine cyclodeaminase family protein [Thermoanaerobaculia bacterium]
MKVLVLSEHDVTELLTMRECIAVMEEALVALARGEVHNPLRQAIRAPGANGLLGLMPAFRGGGTPYYGLKEVCVFPENPKRGLDTHLGAVILHSGETGEPLAFMNAAAITAIRTAAVSAVATNLLARKDAAVLAVIGTGVQGRSHAAAIPLVRDIREIRMCGRGESVQDAVRRADIVVTATSAREPILQYAWLSEGAHVNAVGSSVASARELEAELVENASLFVDRRESTIHESGDYLAAKNATIRAEIGDVLAGKAEGRKSEREITLFKSLGLAVEDLAAAAFLFEKARRAGRGAWVDF